MPSINSSFKTACLAFLFSLSASAGIVGDDVGISPFKKWKTLTTEHFRVNFPDRHEAFALEAARQFESAYSELTVFLMWKPKWRINVNIVDNTDSANGSATPYLRLGITLLVIPPDAYSTIGYSSDWIRTLTWHELTHYINMDTIRSFYIPLSYIFGGMIVPNALQPTWMLEGLAVWTETRFSLTGRGRSPLWEGMLRSQIDENFFSQPEGITLDRVNGDFPWFPGGESSYFFGYFLTQEVAREKPDLLGLLSYRSAGRIPYFINGNLTNVAGYNWMEAWKRFKKRSQDRMTQQVIELEKNTITEPRWLTENGYNALGVAPSPDGKKLALTRRGPDDRSHLEFFDLVTKKVQRSEDKLSGLKLSWSKDSRYLFMSRLEQSRVYDLFSDLFVRDLKKNKTIRLSKRLRAKDPSLSPDEKMLAFSITENGGQSLAVADLSWQGEEPQLSKPRILVSAQNFDRVSTPEFSLDGKTVSYSLLRRGEIGESLWVFDLEKNEAKCVVKNDQRNLYPSYDPQGNLIYVSSQGGVENIFRITGDGKTERLTNVVSAVAAPRWGKDRLYASVLRSTGWDIAELPIPTGSFPLATLTHSPDAPAVDEKSADHSTPIASPKIEKYRAYRTLAPRTWSPSLSAGYSSTIGFIGSVGGSVGGFDSLDLHEYSGELRMVFPALAPEGSLSYSNRQLGVTLGLRYDDLILAQYRAGIFVRDRTVSLTASIPISTTWARWTPAVTFSADRLAPTSGVDMGSTSTDWQAVTDATLVYSQLNRPALAITPISGRRIFTGFRAISDVDLTSFKWAFDYREYIQIHQFSVLVPSLTASVAFPGTSLSTSSFRNVRLLGRNPYSLSGGFYSQSLRQMGVRGYAGITVPVRAAILPALETRFPIFRIFRGVHTWPMFAQNIYGNIFVESAITYDSLNARFLALPALGLGLKLDITAFIPLTFGLDFHYGTNLNEGGGPSVIFSIQGLSALGFGEMPKDR